MQIDRAQNNYTRTDFFGDTYTYDIKSFVYGGIAEIGFLCTSPNLDMNFFMGFFVRVDRAHFSKYVNGVKEKSKKNIFGGCVFGLSLNLL